MIKSKFPKAVFLVLHVVLNIGILAAKTANSADTLRYYIPTGEKSYYRKPGIKLQAARFSIGQPAYLKALRVTLGGAKGSTALIHVYGHEGGLAAPIIGLELTKPVLITKQRDGIEPIDVRISDVFIRNNQFFVAVSKLSGSSFLVSDRIIREPECTELNGNKFSRQLMLMKNGNWEYAHSAYFIDAVLHYTDTEAAVRFRADTSWMVRDSVRQRNIAAGDVNGDGYPDIMSGGRLWIYDAKISTYKSRLELQQTPSAAAFADMDNDGKLDILCFGFSDSLAAALIIYRNTGQDFERSVVNIDADTIAPLSFTIGDFNRDAFLDIFICRKNKNLYLVNDKKLGFTDRSSLLYPSETHSRGLSCSAVDFNSDGLLDIFVVNEYPALNELWLNKGHDRFENMISARKKSMSSMFFTTGTSDWEDYDGNGYPDLLVAHPFLPKLQPARDYTSFGIFRNFGPPDFSFEDYSHYNNIEYEVYQTGGIWADINNDSFTDIITGTSYTCSYADIYLQKANRSFEIFTESGTGLHTLRSCPDALFADFNNDGRLDLAAIQSDSLRLYINESSCANNSYLKINFVSKVDNYNAIGASATVYTPAAHYTKTLTSGRGLLMQGAAVLHYGLGQEKTVDSLVVVWPDGFRKIYRNIVVNRLNTIYREETESANTSSRIPAASISVTPNPFSEKVKISFSTGSTQPVHIEVTTIDGRIVKNLADRVFEAGTHHITWNGADESGQLLANGTYLIHFSRGEERVVNKILIFR